MRIEKAPAVRRTLAAVRAERRRVAGSQQSPPLVSRALSPGEPELHVSLSRGAPLTFVWTSRSRPGPELRMGMREFMGLLPEGWRVDPLPGGRRLFTIDTGNPAVAEQIVEGRLEIQLGSTLTGAVFRVTADVAP